jgi:hypothetical protein
MDRWIAVPLAGWDVVSAQVHAWRRVTMDVQIDTPVAKDQEQPAPVAATAQLVNWVDAAQTAHGFDVKCARRLAFMRWLYRTGRLSDG